MSLKLLGCKKLQIIKFENNTYNLDPAAIFIFVLGKCLTFPWKGPFWLLCISYQIFISSP